MKPRCFLFICSTLFLFNLAECRKSNKNPANDCFEDMVYVDRPEPISGCYKKVGLGRECTFSLQCSSLNANTYCGFSPATLLVKVCLCDEGYSNGLESGSGNPYECLPVRNCSSKTTSSSRFNNYEQRDCGEWQFCREGVCHCKADLTFNETGHCVPVEGKGEKLRLASLELSSCTEEQIYVYEPAKRRGCYPKVALLEECQFSGQCTAMTSSAFCGWSSLNTKNPICLCPDGYRPSSNTSSNSTEENVQNQECIPIRKCSLSDFNVGLEQADCGPEQFCRNNLCFCKPDFEYDPRKGECVRPDFWDYGDGEDDDEDDGYLTEAQKPKRWFNKPAWIVLIISLIAMVFFLGYAALLYHTRKEDERLAKKGNGRKESRDEEMTDLSQKLNVEDDFEDDKSETPSHEDLEVANVPLRKKPFHESHI